MWSGWRKELSGGGISSAVPAGLRVYAIGDIHGCADLLDRLADLIRADLAEYPASQVLGIFLGDYIDRGPDSAGVLARLARQDFPVPFIALRGNHEEMLLNFLDDADYLTQWRHFGGLETLHSFGVPVQQAQVGQGFSEAQRHLRSALTAEVLDFIAGTRASHALGDYFFCHAGVRPGISLDRQDMSDLLWIRGDFLEYPDAYEKIIVHGHTPVEAPDVRRNRINIDTGAYLTGTLTCLVLESETRRFLESSI